jgi:hypothetical protein
MLRTRSSYFRITSSICVTIVDNFARNRIKPQETPGIPTLHYAAQTVAAWYMIGGYWMLGALWVRGCFPTLRYCNMIGGYRMQSALWVREGGACSAATRVSVARNVANRFSSVTLHCVLFGAKGDIVNSTFVT